jgi:hypothetical protein
MNPATEEKLNIWRKLFEEREQSGLSIKEYCKVKNIAPSQFYYYQNIITKPNKAQEISKKQKDTAAGIKPIQLISSAAKESSSIRLILPNSLQCVLPREISPHEIKTILEVLMSC